MHFDAKGAQFQKYAPSAVCHVESSLAFDKLMCQQAEIQQLPHGHILH